MRSKNGTSTGVAPVLCTMPRISGQNGARISTSSPAREERARGVRESRRGAAGDEHLVALAGDLVAAAEFLDDRVDQRRDALRRGVAVDAGMRGLGEILHAAAVEGVAPGVADVERIHGPRALRDAVAERRVDGARHGRDGGGEVGRTRHRLRRY